MKHIKLVARQKIINPSTGEIYDDNGLRALNGYYEKVIEIDDSSDVRTVVSDYLDKHPELNGFDIKIY